MKTYEERYAEYERLSRVMSTPKTANLESEILWDIAGFEELTEYTGQHIDYDCMAMARIYGVTVEYVRRLYINVLSKCGYPAECALFLRYMHDYYDNPVGDNGGVFRL